MMTVHHHRNIASMEFVSSRNLVVLVEEVVEVEVVVVAVVAVTNDNHNESVLNFIKIKNQFKKLLNDSLPIFLFSFI